MKSIALLLLSLSFNACAVDLTCVGNGYERLPGGTHDLVSVATIRVAVDYKRNVVNYLGVEWRFDEGAPSSVVLAGFGKFHIDRITGEVVIMTTDSKLEFKGVCSVAVQKF